MVTRTDEPLHVSEDELCRALAIVEDELGRSGAPHSIKVREWIDPELDEDFSTMIWASITEPIPTQSFVSLLSATQTRLVSAGLVSEDHDGPLNFTMSPSWSTPPTS